MITAWSCAIYLVSALLLRLTSGYPFPLLPVAAWVAAYTVIAWLAGSGRQGVVTYPGIAQLSACVAMLGSVFLSVKLFSGDHRFGVGPGPLEPSLHRSDFVEAPVPEGQSDPTEEGATPALFARSEGEGEE